MLKVYLRLPEVADCGVGYYRQWLPLMKAVKNKKLKMKCQHFTWGEKQDENLVDENDLNKMGTWADILYYARNDVPNYLAQAGGLKEYLYERDKVYKPAVLDIDDNVHATRPYNPGYRSFHPNSPHLAWNLKSLEVFDALTVSTDSLKRFYSKHFPKELIYTLPNSIDFGERDRVYNMKFAKSKIFKKKKNEIRIGWTGSAAHWENLKHIESAVIEILKEYPNTTFMYSGLFGDLFQEKSIRERVVPVRWSNLKNWAKFNREVNFDIALAPLMDNDFNRAKSNLRILEYASARYPVIASPIEPYLGFEDEILYAKEDFDWYDKIKTLIEDEDVRKDMSEKLYKRAKKDFSIDRNYTLWVSALKSIHGKSQKSRKFN